MVAADGGRGLVVEGVCQCREADAEAAGAAGAAAVAMRLRRRRIMLLYVLILLLARRAQLFGGRAVRQRVEAVTVDAEQICEAANHEWIFNVRNGGRRDLLARPNVDDAAVRTDREIRL